MEEIIMLNEGEIRKALSWWLKNNKEHQDFANDPGYDLYFDKDDNGLWKGEICFPCTSEL